MAKKDFDHSKLTDIQLRRILRKRKREKTAIKVAVRLVIMLLFFLLLITLILFGLKKAFLKPESQKTVLRGTIFIDPGHGGKDPGAREGGRTEKKDTLEFGFAIKKAVEKEGFRVSMSRTTDEFVGRKERADRANKSKAKLMLSIHRNTGPDGHGVEIWIPSANNSNDKLLGENIMAEIKKVGITQDRGVHGGSLVNAKKDYAENKYSKMPSVLIEFGFIGNEEDNELFDEKMNEYARAVAKGISSTFASIYETE